MVCSLLLAVVSDTAMTMGAQMQFRWLVIGIADVGLCLEMINLTVLSDHLEGWFNNE